MGLRTASVRRPHVDVMAPALKDTVQAQNFDLPPKSHLEPASPINSFETSKFPPAAAAEKNSSKPASPLNTDDLSTSLEALNSDSDSCPKTAVLDRYLSSFNGASDNCFTENNMSLSSSPMGDSDDKMGLQKSELTVSNVNKNSRNSSDVDQLFNANLEANVEDIMQQVIKSIENSDQLNNSSTDLTEVLDINIDKELLEHVDNMMNMGIDDQPDDLETAQKMKETQANEQLTDLKGKHWRIERRLDFLKRRCLKLQSRLMGRHISAEVVGVFEHVHRTIKKPKDHNDTLNSFGASCNDSADKLKPLTALSAKQLVKKLEMAKSLQANAFARQKNVPKYFGSGSIEASLFRNSTSGQVNIPQWTADNKQELRKVTDQLKVQLHLLQDQLDSEATESSSGGESCDEFQTYNNPHQQYLTIQKRALWKYSTERASIAARWTWLQSQISDLEYRIRQHAELNKRLTTVKGVIELGEVVIRPKPVQSQPEIAGHHDYGASPVESTNVSMPLNGYVGQLPGATGSKSSDDDDCQYCARTRPLVNFKKRRLLQIGGLHAVSKNAARPSTVRCNCMVLKNPCALCTGRADPTHPRDSTDTLGSAEKVVLLDPCYHRVLSAPEDISQTLHFEAIMKMNEWQQRSIKMKTIKVLHKPERMEPRSYEHRTKKLEHRKKYSRLKSSTAAALSEKIKKKLRGRRAAGRQTKLNKRHSLVPDTETGGSEDAEVEATIGKGSQVLAVNASQTRPTPFDSPGGSPLLQMQSISGYKQNNRNNRAADSYDIDNIVIPYSVAAATRVEKLQYKEILTPKWRIAEEELFAKSDIKSNGSVADFMEENDTEDLSEEAVIARHDRCEHDEKKRFLSYLKFPLGVGRPRSHKRNDSMAESSGANTPDPASPRPEGAKTGSDVPLPLMASPPPTPVPGNEDVLPSIALMRRRTTSQSRFREVKEEGPPVDYVEQPPYETRSFPLVDKDYDSMIQEMPDAHREVKTNYRAQDTGDDVIAKSETQESVDSESTESAIECEDAVMDYDDDIFMEEDEDEEDPNDPEWTDVEKSSQKDRHHRR
ncbi:KAT8 regulatory NSL complex subunit 1 [Dendroctonus ponderosae]|uniref:KAT8 regulatory NSL complex subunit 1 n=1 Tax=Dendroctonus ponderosae TaxID=77166 RepID=UPI0020356650|nr:KAT8 regulatory NSL complex subunit 1 [Dendroctonus ponderosae]XP_048524054.1 KAT8 regulatory NSL complex subunit 1 [Dendroctonus ponderosae]KAH1012608.1 hypothetical protein HUJ05_011740 [Dendroctonus ponderosae]KAH1012609.1 hypothetical protein HUJ05_011740 [Dendroctonus ponderosae]